MDDCVYASVLLRKVGTNLLDANKVAGLPEAGGLEVSKKFPTASCF